MKDKELVFATRQAMVKQVAATEFSTNNRTVAGTKLAEGDALVFVCPVEGQKDVVLQTDKGMFLRFALEEIPVLKKISKGVRGIRMAEGESLEAMYLLGGEQVVDYKGKPVHLHRLKAAKRDGKGSKARV